MSKAVTFLCAILLFFGSVSSIFAKSGCCSGHDGVNCGAGAQSNGNVVCNDGWKGSSCSYAEMVMCGGSSNSAAPVQSAATVAIPAAPIIQPSPQVISEKPKQILTSEQLQKIKCDAATKKAATQIKTQEKKKEGQLNQLRKAIATLEKKVFTNKQKNFDTSALSEKIESLTEAIDQYQSGYDEYTSKLYEVKDEVCNEDKEVLMSLQSEAQVLAKSVTKEYQNVQKLLSQAKLLKLKKVVQE